MAPDSETKMTYRSCKISKHTLISTLPSLGLFCATIIWASTFIVVKNVLCFIDPIILVGYRTILASIILAIALLVRRKKLFTDLKTGLLLGVVLWGYFVFQALGLKYTTASNSGFITGLFVVFVPLFSFIFFHKLPSLRKIFAIVLSVAGIWILVGGLHGINKGDIFILICSMCCAGHLLLTDKYVKKGADPHVLCFQQFFCMGILSFIVGAIFHLPFTLANIDTVWTILYLTLFATLSAFVIQLAAQKYAAPMKVALIFSLQPIFALIFARIFGGENLTLHEIIGGGMMFTAILLAEIQKRKRQPNLELV